MLLKSFIFCLITVHLALCMPRNDKDLFEDDPESRIKRRRRPCRGRSDGDGRTFLDWSFQYLDVNYNYNYNINCGGSGGGGDKPDSGLGGGNKPGLGGGNKPGLGGGNKPGLGGGLFGGNHQGGGLFGGNGPLGIFSQSQSQGIFGNGGLFGSDGLGSLLPQGGIFGGEGLGSWLPQGLFNGQGIGSLFENGLFSNIFNRPSGSGGGNNQVIPVTTANPDVQDPDDIIYNDEKPVHEDHDDVVPDAYSNYKPAPYRHREYQNYRSNNIRFS